MRRCFVPMIAALAVAPLSGCAADGAWVELKGARIPVEIADEQTWELHFSEISQCSVIVDAIFGTGLKAAVAGMMETVIADVNASDIPIVSIDLPSGLSADTPHLVGDCIQAAMTVTLPGGNVFANSADRPQP